VADRCGRGKNAILVEALSRYLGEIDRDWFAAKARRESELVSGREREAGGYEMAYLSGLMSAAAL
jgi:hypothetical protein